jgi:addiction module HigA family antidote
MNTAPHPGAFVREYVIPKGMNVTQAAALLEVSRPTLSKLLNGSADLSPDMAARLEVAFGTPARTLLDFQSAWDAERVLRHGKVPIIRSYVPPFLQIKAARIEQWASTGLAPRQRLSVFLRTLVNSTGVGLSQSNFPGNDSSELHGWDGETQAQTATPWIPAGHAVWEFGTNEVVKAKADQDFKKSVEAIADNKQRREITFIFVTPRIWPGKTAWLKEQKAKKLWKDVRAYDAADLEQWLEQSLSAQTWFASETRQLSHGTVSLDQAWVEWAADCSPSLSPALFGDAIASCDRVLQHKLGSTPFEPIVIIADSKDEALAFLSVAFDATRSEFGRYRDQIIVFREPGALSKLAAQVSNFIPVITSAEIEMEFAPFRTSMPSIIVYPYNATASDADILLESVGYDTFNSALKSMGADRDEIDRLSRESGRSLTVLRRRLSKLPAVRSPSWASNPTLACSLVPFAFAGAWKVGNDMDQLMLEALGGDLKYKELEKSLTTFRALDGSPIWMEGGLAGVVSKIDALFAVRNSVTRHDLKRFFDVADLVLSEDDPSLELPERERWAAGIYGKTRQISGALRDGIAETLVLLAVHGHSLFSETLQMDPREMAASLVRSLLTPLTLRTLESQVDNLMLYAEAAPEVFLSIIENDISSPDPASIQLMRPQGDLMFGRVPRVGLLWALEGLAWSNSHFLRTVLVLAQLSERKLDDNHLNKPYNSLASIFRSWMPQTSVSVEARKAALTKLSVVHPNIAWSLCLEQLSSNGGIGHYSHKPRWRPDARGYGEPISGPERSDFVDFACKLAVNWPGLNAKMLSELVGTLVRLPEELQLEIWDRVDEWAEVAEDTDKAMLRERIRVSILSQRALKQQSKAPAPKSVERARNLFERLCPTNVVLQHAWLFEKPWIEVPPDAILDQNLDYNAREERIREIRDDAVREVFSVEGVLGLVRLAELGEAHYVIGWALANVTFDDATLVGAIATIVSLGPIEGARLGLVRGALGCAGSSGRAILEKTVVCVPQAMLQSLLCAAPFNRATWQVLDALSAPFLDTYWQEVQPQWTNQEPDLIEATTRLLAANRPRAAFHVIEYSIDKLPSYLLFDLLNAIAKGSFEAPNTYLLERHSLQQAIKNLGSSGDIATDQVARLEFHFIDIYNDDTERPEHLEKMLCESPDLFVQMCIFAFKRSDGNMDPSDLTPSSPEHENSRAHSAYRLLESTSRIPGTEKNGVINRSKLENWIAEVRAGCTAFGRRDVGDRTIGKLLSKALKLDNQAWPSGPLCDVLEGIMTDQLSYGLEIGLNHSCGIQFRGPGGDSERASAAKYRGWAEAVEFTYPRVSKFLRRMEHIYTLDAEREDLEARVSKRLDG